MTRRVIPDGDGTVPAPRSLGRRPGQACSGNDTRLSDARETVQVNGVDVGKRRFINFVDGTNVTITGTDLPDDDKVQVEISSSGGGSGNVRIDKDAVTVANVNKINFTDSGYATITAAYNVTTTAVDIDVACYIPESVEAIAGITPSADKLAYYNSGTTALTTDLTAFGRSLIDDVDAAAARTTLGIVGGGAQGLTTIDFGAFPGSSDASLAITGQAGIDSTSVVTAWLQPADTDDHTADEHRIETISVMAGNVIGGTGFTIYAQNTSQTNEPLLDNGASTSRPAATTVYGYTGMSVGGKGTRIYGKWTVAWKWS